MDLELRDKVCVVTGASSGIGLETTRRLVAEGARVLMVARDGDRLEALASELGADYVAADVTEAEADDRIVATCAEQMGGIDVLVNNAGTSFARPLDDLTDDDWNAQWELHVMAPMRLMRAAAPAMGERGWGRIVNVSSSSGKRPSAATPEYSVAKAAELSLSRLFADRYAGQGVLINAVCPGAAKSPLWTAEGGLLDQIMEMEGLSSREEALEAAAAGRPIGRIAEPEEIAGAIVFLCSEQASYTSGAAWSVDGGVVQIII